jgi:ABC-type polysaccharide/polyol phosphate transport system ATPase subunit
LATALVKINSLTSGKIHDMSQIGNLLDLAGGIELPTSTINDLRMRQQFCLLAYENLKDLRSKVLKYDELEPILFK